VYQSFSFMLCRHARVPRVLVLVGSVGKISEALSRCLQQYPFSLISVPGDEAFAQVVYRRCAQIQITVGRSGNDGAVGQLFIAKSLRLNRQQIASFNKRERTLLLLRLKKAQASGTYQRASEPASAIP
jgi:hypothetical protein